MSNVSMCYNCVLVASTCHIFVQILRSSRCSVRGRQFPQKKTIHMCFIALIIALIIEYLTLKISIKTSLLEVWHLQSWQCDFGNTTLH